MRTIKYTSKFKRDYKREKRSTHHGKNLDRDLIAITKLLMNDTALPPSYHDHQLVNDWKDHRDCHIKPDLILIYRKPDVKTLEFVRLGSHSQLGF
jgi:mRNA interferase YafQ